MTGNRQRDIEVLFVEAVQLPDEERIAFLDRVCAGDTDLRQKLEALLQSNAQIGDFLEEPPTGFIAESRANITGREKSGDWIGRYKLVHEIGEGGCGVVFVAEQQEPICRRVALKVIKPGMDTRSVIARFEAERQALALMDHPNIAQVHDAGATESGRPFFVMELVEGVKISDYCDQHFLSLSERLKLFVQVCDAIQHAHQKGIIHRDIKPSNVLVTKGPGGKPTPKVIDFGIAKATTDQQLTDKTIFTACEMLIGTPAYMSPEQAALTSADLDTRTDIYSLGVLLYELLTGTTPFDARELLKAGFDEVRRVVREVEPVRPSTRLTTMQAAGLANVSKHHGAEAPKLVREMRGDLDWIVMKALEKDRARRYATANGFAMDIERYLVGEAVLARPPSAAYKFRKLVARNKLVFSSVTLIFVFLVISLITTTRWLMLERGAREKLLLREKIERVEMEGLGFALQGKLAGEEQSYRRALELRRKLGIDIGAEPSCRSLLRVFKAQKRLDKIRPLLTEFVDSPVLSRGSFGAFRGIFQDEINTLAQHGLWDDADALTATLQRAIPSNNVHDQTRAALLVVRGDVDGYRRLCEKMISDLRPQVLSWATLRDLSPVLPELAAKNCLIIPASGVDLIPVRAMADMAVAGGSNSSYKVVKALAEFRLGNYEDSAKWAQLAIKSKTPGFQAQALAIVAMSQFKLNQLDKARGSLADCNEVVEDKLPKLTKPGFSDLGKDWRDWIIAHALQSEAKRMIEPAAAAPSTTLPR